MTSRRRLTGSTTTARCTVGRRRPAPCPAVPAAGGGLPAPRSVRRASGCSPGASTTGWRPTGSASVATAPARHSSKKSTQQFLLQSCLVRAVVCQQLGPLDDLLIEDRQPLVPGPDEVVIDVRAAGVNYVDGLICQGRYQIRPPTPFVPGSEIAGEVSSVGAAVNGVSPGDRVTAMTGFGGFAEQAAVPAASVIALPANLDFGQAAAL